MSRSRRKSRRRSTRLRFAVRAVVAVVIAGCVLAGAAGYALGPVSGRRRAVRFVVRRRASAPSVAADLNRDGLVRSALACELYMRVATRTRGLKAGVYTLASNLSTPALVERLQRGPLPSDGVTVTIPEGFTARQIAERLAHDGVIATPDAFLEVVRRDWRRLHAPFELPAVGPEGYLYPDTYTFAPGTPPEAIAQTMLDTFTRRFYRPNLQRIAARGRSLNEIVTIASLIEREAEVPQDRARIAGVIENRLKRDMRLQIDATVEYALGRHKSRVTYADLRAKSPYNTYLHPGLPPGPIANPGEASLDAALAPEHNDFLFYVAGPGGAHVFTRTQAQHVATVRKMRAWRRVEAAAVRGR